jgi:hypothetical protein
MDKILSIVNWVLNNKEVLLQGVVSVIGVASIIVKLTPTLKDDNILLPIVKFLGKYIALNKTVTDEQRPIV